MPANPPEIIRAVDKNPPLLLFNKTKKLLSLRQAVSSLFTPCIQQL